MFKRYNNAEEDSPLEFGGYSHNKFKKHNKKYKTRKNLLLGVRGSQVIDGQNSELDQNNYKIGNEGNKPRLALSNSQPNVKPTAEEIKQIVNMRNKRQSRYDFKGLKNIHKANAK